MNDNQVWQLIRGWITLEESLEWKEKLYKNLNWQQPIVKVYGKRFLVPRKTVFLGDKHIKYKYSGYSHDSVQWPNWFYPLLDRVCSASNSKFNGCLINLYRNGIDRMGWHSDNEKELDLNQSIASLSLGASRDFLLKHRRLFIKEKINLKNGDLLIMHPECHREWVHSLPSRKNISDFRINLTFRAYL